MLINFEKAKKTFEELVKAFENKESFPVEIVAADSAILTNTSAEKIFLKSIEWIDDRKCLIKFVTLFNLPGIIPGTYKMEVEKKDIERSNQTKAYPV